MPQEKHVNQSIEIIIADRICDDTRVSAVEFGGVGSSGTPVTIYFPQSCSRIRIRTRGTATTQHHQRGVTLASNT